MSSQVLDPEKKEKLSQQTERLAMLLVTADLSGSDSPDTIEQLQAAVDAVYQSAQSAGLGEAIQFASGIKERLAAAAQTTPGAGLESELQSGITKLQAALGQSGAGPEGATTGARSAEA